MFYWKWKTTVSTECLSLSRHHKVKKSKWNHFTLRSLDSVNVPYSGNHSVWTEEKVQTTWRKAGIFLFLIKYKWAAKCGELARRWERPELGVLSAGPHSSSPAHTILLCSPPPLPWMQNPTEIKIYTFNNTDNNSLSLCGPRTSGKTSF